MTRAPLHSLLAAGLLLLVGCSDSPVSPNQIEPQFAKGGGGPPAPWTPAQFAFPASGYDLVGDGLPYIDSECGVSAQISPDGTIAQTNVSSLDPSCGDRTVTISLGLRHVGYDGSGNDIDDPNGVGVWDVPGLKIRPLGTGFTDAVVIDTRACGHQGRNGKWSITGLRFQSATYAGTDDLVFSNQGGVWQITSQAYPNNIAYCDGDATGGPSYWHVDVTMTVSAS